MKTLHHIPLALFLLLGFSACSSLPKGAFQRGEASWYGQRFHGRTTASGQPYNMNAMTAAHPELPFGTRVRVMNQKNGRQVIVTINDRGPYSGGRIIDVSKAAAKKLGMIRSGVAPVLIYLLRP